MLRLSCLVLLLAAGAARALTVEELREDPAWSCALDLARGDLLAEQVARRYGLSWIDARRAALVERVLRSAEAEGDTEAIAAFGWWKRAADAGCE